MQEQARRNSAQALQSQTTVAAGSGSGRSHCCPSRGQLGPTEWTFHAGYKVHLPETFHQ